MSKILGKYIIRAKMSYFTSAFTFQNAGRDERLVLDESKMLAFECTDITKPVNNGISFVSENVLKVRAVRILATGAEGLRAGKGDKAANLLFRAYATNDTTTPVGMFQVGVDRFDEWQPVNIDFMVEDKPNQNYYLGLSQLYTFLSIDDFNIQADYVGETFVPILELEVDTAGIYDYQEDLV